MLSESMVEVDVEAVLAWGDFMVSLSTRRRSGALAGEHGHRPPARRRPARRPRAPSRSTACDTAEHVVLANGADPGHPADPWAVRELDGIWTYREATGMKAVPRRLLVIGRWARRRRAAQAVQRLWPAKRWSRVPSASSPRREPAPLGVGARRGPAPRRHSSFLPPRPSPPPLPGPARTLRPSARGRPRAARRPAASWPRAGGRAWTASGSRASASQPTPTASRSTRGCARPSGCGRSAT